MSTFVIRLFDRPADELAGRIHHVGTGEEAIFSSASDLVGFIEGITAMQRVGDRAPAGSDETEGMDEVPVDQRTAPRDPRE